MNYTYIYRERDRQTDREADSRSNRWVIAAVVGKEQDDQSSNP